MSATYADRDEGVGSARDGQTVPYELGVRVVIWPPSRPAQLYAANANL
jgi:hypothetical protein